jgi:hypothetical protein
LKFKLHINKTRNFIFSLIEKWIIHLSRFTPMIRTNKNIIVFFTPRPGRGLTTSEVDNLFFDSLPKQIESQSKFLHYNTRLWIVNTLKLLKYQKKYKVNKIVLIQYVAIYHYSPSLKLLKYLSNKKIEIIKVWLDTYSDDLWDKRINIISDLGTVNIIVDTPKLRIKNFVNTNSYVYSPIPIKSFEFIPYSRRTRFLYYSGGIENSGLYKPRKDVLDFLKLHNVKVEGTHYDRVKPGRRPSYEIYRRELSGSLVGLNFTWKGDENVLVTRTWEIFSSGALLLQNKSDQFQDLFISGVHFLEYSDNKELLEILETLRKDRILLETIALAGKKRYEELFDTDYFWKKVWV